ncbi:haloacid dehalogenase-like hydrolase [Chloroflexi bacterium TSY]|nr:haloacid dehalogenase-like hydrolase [Chloroflexi bacterium TSY]
MTRIAAIFDLDETLLTDASGRLFARYLRKTDRYPHTCANVTWPTQFGRCCCILSVFRVRKTQLVKLHVLPQEST